MLRLLLDQHVRSEYQKTRKRLLIVAALIVLKNPVIGLSYLARMLRVNDQRGLMRKLFWLPVGIIKVRTNNSWQYFVMEKCPEYKLQHLRKQLEEKDPGPACSREQFKSLMELIPKNLEPVVKNIVNNAATLTTRQAKEMGIFHPFRFAATVKEMMRLAQQRQREVDAVVLKLLDEVKFTELDEQISTEIEDYYKPMKNDAALDVLRKIKSGILTTSEVADICGVEEPYELHRYVTQLTNALKTVTFSEEHARILDELNVLVESLPSYADVDVRLDEEEHDPEAIKAKFLHNFPTDQREKQELINRIARTYKDSIVSWATRKKRHIWYLIQWQKQKHDIFVDISPS